MKAVRHACRFSHRVNELVKLESRAMLDMKIGAVFGAVSGKVQ
jgi:hypothetical protein